MAHAVCEERTVVEGGAAVGIAALLSGKVDRLGGKVVVVVSGANVDMAVLTATLAQA
jgi:threonine dehydratase